MDVSSLNQNTANVVSHSETNPALYTGSGNQTPHSPVTQVAQAQLAQAQLTVASTSSSTSPSTALPLAIHVPVIAPVTYPTSFGGIKTFFQEMEKEIKGYLQEAHPYGYQPPSGFNRSDFCKPGFETFNKFIQINKQTYDLGRRFVNKLALATYEKKVWFVCHAAQRGCAALLKLTRHCGIDLEEDIEENEYYKCKRESSFAGTPLSLSIDLRDIRAVGALLSAGVNPNQRDFFRGGTPFMSAATEPWCVKTKSLILEILQLLIQKGADINATTDRIYESNFEEHGYTALMLARRQPERVTELLGLGVDKEICTSCGNTALMLLVIDVACGKGWAPHLNSIRHLLHANANIFVKNHAYDNLLTIAAAGESLELVQLLLQSVDSYTSRNFPGASRWKAKFEIKGSFLEARNGQGKTPLMVAIEKGRTRIALELINAGADFEAVFIHDNTPKRVRNMLEDRNAGGLWKDVLDAVKQQSR